MNFLIVEVGIPELLQAFKIGITALLVFFVVLVLVKLIVWLIRIKRHVELKKLRKEKKTWESKSAGGKKMK